MAFTPAHLLQILRELPSPRRYLIAFSGGCDSVVLLHAMAALQDKHQVELAAIHVNHGLQADAVTWARHCDEICRQLNVPLIQVEVSLQVDRGESLEAKAREVRYKAINEHMSEGEMLLTAQHQDDQAETVLLQLLRGSGPSGLAAMPQLTPFAAGFHARPLLAFSRKQLNEYAIKQGLKWVEDSSNQDIRFDRNYLRQEVMPLLAHRWPSVARTFSRSAKHCAEAQQLIDDMAADALNRVEQLEGTLSIQELIALPAAECRAVLRSWIQRKGYQLPDTQHLDRIQTEMLHTASDRKPLVAWSGCELRRYRNQLFIMPPLTPHDPQLVLVWDGVSPLQLPAGLGVMATEQAEKGIDQEKWNSGHIEVRFRRGGERCHLAGRKHSHSLKKLLQDKGLPPWQRDRIPLIYINDQLAAIAGLWICEPFLAPKNHLGILPVY